MMHLSFPFFTPTMARLFAEQGYLRKAAQIYRYLLKIKPDRHGLWQELCALEEKIQQQSHPSHKELGLMMREWVVLLKEQKQFARESYLEKGEDNGSSKKIERN
jgi:hypothetical protein